MKEEKDRYDVMFSPHARKGGDKTGQNHAVDNEKDPSKTLCGKPLSMWVRTGLELEKVTCLICRGILKKRGIIQVVEAKA